MDLFTLDPPAPIEPPPPPAAEPPFYVAHAANPTPPFTSNNHNHPPYAEMITAAITALKERNGSSRQAIAKYIEKNYSSLPSNHAALLTHHLKRLKNIGQLQMVKHSYKLPSRSVVPLPSSTVPVAVAGNGNGSSSSGPKRGPGRPPKPKVDDTQPNDAVFGPEPMMVAGPESVLASLGLADVPDPVAPLGTKRGPGRPPKAKKSGLVMAAGAEFGGPVGIKRRPGRPPRQPKSLPVLMDQSGMVGAELSGPVSVPVAVKKGRGRPPKRPKSLPVLMGQGGLKMRPGRQPRPIGSRPRGRPKKDGSGVKPLGRPRGRRPKNAVVPVPAAGGEGEAFVAVAGGVLPVKRRGRPAGAARAKKPRKLSGRPLGRPRKNASIAGIQEAANQHSVAYEDLKNKVHYVQSRIIQAVSVVKPHLNPETAVSAFGALQELEQLATMDLSVPFNVQVHIQVQEPLIHNQEPLLHSQEPLLHN